MIAILARNGNNDGVSNYLKRSLQFSVHYTMCDTSYLFANSQETLNVVTNSFAQGCCTALQASGRWDHSGSSKGGADCRVAGV